MNNNVDLTNCDKEPIHKLGKVQQYGGLLGLSENWQIVFCSHNIEKFSKWTSDDCLGKAAEQILLPETIAKCKEAIASNADSDQTQRLFGEYVFSRNEFYDLSIHLSGDIIVIEFEHHQPLVNKNSLSNVRSRLRQLSQTDNLDSFFMHACDAISNLTGFDRIMLYRFHNDGSGEVIAENVLNDMDSFLGLRYPASDIPQQARKLYVRNLTRLIEDVNAETVDIDSKMFSSGEELDLSMGTLRAVSPIHIEYLKNMGVGASFSLSIIVDGELWGLFACHHNSAQYISLEMRSIIEVYGEVFSLELTSRLRNLSLANTESAKSLHVKMMSSLNSDASILTNLEPYMQSLQRLIPCDTAVLWVENKLAKAGSPISNEDAQLLISKLNDSSSADIICTDNLKGYFGESITVSDRFSGLLAVPISRFPKDFLVFLRKEETQSINWAGNPEKPVDLGPNGIRLTPRKSFSAWQEIRRGYSAPWLQQEIGLAQALKQMLLEVVVRNIDERERLNQQSQQQQDVLVSELNHRVRNILGLISSVVAKTATGANDVTEFKDVLGGRINSIAEAQNHLTERNWSHAPLTKLFSVELSAYITERISNVSVGGPEVYLEPKAYTTLTLVVHELVTNALKHGALLNDRGTLNIEWELNADNELAIKWQEYGYDNQPSLQKGFGTVIIERSIPFDLNGSSNVEHHASGMNVVMIIPSKYIYLTPSKSSSSMSKKAPVQVKSQQQSSGIKTALVLEDNMIIALDVEDTLLENAVEKVIMASNTVEAAAIIKNNAIDFAVLDVNLGGENSYSIGELCQKMGIPFVFVTGYNELQGVKDNGFEDATLLLKPVKSAELLKCLNEA
jgi:light-regulated signal transduction histidine kinase (bacteriophytochrome)